MISVWFFKIEDSFSNSSLCKEDNMSLKYFRALKNGVQRKATVAKSEQ